MTAAGNAFLVPEKPTLPPQEMEHYFRAIERASDRSRWHTIALAIACILTLVATYNAMPSSWLVGRLELARAARQFYTASPALRDSLMEGNPRLYQRARNLLAQQGFMTDTGRPLPSVHALPVAAVPGDASATAGEGAAVFIDWYAFDLDRQVERLEAAKLRELIVLDIPVLGIILDLNDLGLVAGIALVILLVMRGLSIANEYFAMRSALAHAAREGCLPGAYEAVATSAVFVVPLRDLAYHAEHGVGAKVWSYRMAPMFVNLLPVAALLFILGVDVWTFDQGVLVNPANTLTSVLIGVAALIAVAILVARNLKVEFNLTRMLDDVALGFTLRDDRRIALALHIPEDFRAARWAKDPGAEHEHFRRWVDRHLERRKARDAEHKAGEHPATPGPSVPGADVPGEGSDTGRPAGLAPSGATPPPTPSSSNPTAAAPGQGNGHPGPDRPPSAPVSGSSAGNGDSEVEPEQS